LPVPDRREAAERRDSDEPVDCASRVDKTGAAGAAIDGAVEAETGAVPAAEAEEPVEPEAGEAGVGAGAGLAAKSPQVLQ